MKLRRTNYGRFSIKCKGPMTWNTLPDVLKKKSLQMFRKELKTFVLNQNIDYEIKYISLSIILLFTFVGHRFIWLPYIMKFFC